jgi:hypothetical protein
MGRKILGVFVGLVVDIVISLLLGLAMGIALAVYLATQGVSTHDMPTRLTALTHTTLMMLAQDGLGIFGTLVGGFLCGWIARSSRVTCGAIMGFCSCLAGVPFWGSWPLWFNLLGVVLTLLMAVCGGWLADAVFGRKQPGPPPSGGTLASR